MRDEFEYKALAKGFDFLFDDPQELEILNAQMQVQGILTEMWEKLFKVRDKNTESFREAFSRIEKLTKVISIIDLLYGKNRLLKHKLLISENELSNYHFIYSQLHGFAKTTITGSIEVDRRIPYPDNI